MQVAAKRFFKSRISQRARGGVMIIFQANLIKRNPGLLKIYKYNSKFNGIEDEEKERKRNFCSMLTSDLEVEISLRTPTERAREFWSPQLDKLKREESKSLLKYLDLNFILGVAPEKGKKVPCFRFFEEEKKRHPSKIVLVRIGDFYEAIGTDAVVIVNETDVVAFNCSYEVPRVKCSVRNRDELIRILVSECGLEVVICEESDKLIAVANSKKMVKGRYISQILTSLLPLYHRSDPDSENKAFIELETRNPAVASVSWSETGYVLCEYYPNTNSFRKVGRMTEEGLLARLHAIQVTPPLYLHKSIFATCSNHSSEVAKWERRMRRIAPRFIGPVKIYNNNNNIDEDGFKLFQNEVLNRLSINLNMQMPVRMVEEDEVKRTLPPPLSTVAEIGMSSVAMAEEEGIYDLLDFLVETKNKQIRGWMKRILLIPPPQSQAKCIRHLNEKLALITQPLPEFKLDLSAIQIVQVIRSGNGGISFFLSLRNLLSGVLEILKNSDFDSISQDLLCVIKIDTDNCNRFLIENNSLQSLLLISKVVEDEAYEVDVGNKKEAIGGALNQLLAATLDRVQIKRDLISKELERVKLEFGRVREEIKNIDIIFKESNCKYSLICSTEWKTIWIKPTATELSESVIKNLKKFIGKNGIEKKSFFTNPSLEDAIDNYKFAISDLESSIRSSLRLLCEKLTSTLPFLVQAAHLALAAASLSDHVKTARLRGWILPHAEDSDISENITDLELEEFWPYWMDGSNLSTVKNSIEIRDMIILTGPNMGGKSTVLRSVAAICCLGLSGLYVPALSAHIPYLDSVILKTFVRDSPIEMKSSFAIEMQEMASILQDSNKNTLVLIDELGKGTEVVAGTSLSAAILEELAKRKVKGIFATHLHKLKPLVEEMPGVSLYKMRLDTDPSTGKKLQSWKIEPGYCDDSLGFDMAVDQGIDVDIVKRGREIVKDRKF